MDKTQRYILLAMPLVFLLFVANFPAGLVIYWVTTNLWTVGQGLVTRGLRKPAEQPQVAKRSSRTPPGNDGKRAPAPAPAVASGSGSQPRRVKKKKKKRANR